MKLTRSPKKMESVGNVTNVTNVTTRQRAAIGVDTDVDVGPLPLPFVPMGTADEVPAQVWRMIVSEAARDLVHGARGDALQLLQLLTLNKKIVGLARDAAVRFGRVGIRCTVAQIPRAIRVFEHARELRVVGDDAGDDHDAGAQEVRLDQVDHVKEAQVALDALVASEALGKTGRRFRVFVSDVTDSVSKMGWLPMLPRREEAEKAKEADDLAVRVLCECYETKTFETVAENLARNYDAGWMTHLVIDYLGGRDHEREREHGSGFPNLSRFQGGAGLRVRLQQGDFEALDFEEAHFRYFRSTSVTWLELMWCDLVRVPPVRGFPNLTRLDVTECVFAEWASADADVLRSLSDAPVPPIEYLGLVGCDGVDDVSPIAVLALTKLKTLVMHECQGDYPHFDDAASDVLKGKLLAGELNGGGTGCLCKVLVRRLGIRKPEREATGMVQCDSGCCGPCECGECSDCE